MSQRPLPWVAGACCFLLALFFLVQFLGLLFVHRIAVKAADPNREVRVPLSVRFVGVVADRLHQEVLNEPLNPDGSNWPSAFRWFFVLQLCGLAGICVALTQLGVGVIKKQSNWNAQARTILMSSFLALIIGVCFLKLIKPNRELPVSKQTSDEFRPVSSFVDARPVIG